MPHDFGDLQRSTLVFRELAHIVDSRCSEAITNRKQPTLSFSGHEWLESSIPVSAFAGCRFRGFRLEAVSFAPMLGLITLTYFHSYLISHSPRRFETNGRLRYKESDFLMAQGSIDASIEDLCE